ncbi:hypothetical protein FBU31_006292 [Coemansia sp. 'formosensis']|nr:hypothetical protein FBU31_006292 [Coemansia sp. 'formosensis']
MFCITILFLFVLVAVDAATQHYFYPSYDPLGAWIHEQSRYARSRILANIAPFADDPHTMPGAVCASPSRARPDYYYAWTRDSALVMNEILSWPDDNNTDIVLDHYVAFTRHVQALHSTYGLGEAKYHMNGSVFTGSWCNAQTDGPAIRALALIRLAERRLPHQSIDYLFGSWGAPIRVDLDYVAGVWWQNGYCDIWEESRGLHFYTALAQHHALKAGAKIAHRVGDKEAGERYARVAADIEVMLRDKFTTITRPHLPTTIEWSGGLPTKHSNLDTQVLLASLHFAKEGAFSVNSSEMLSTVLAILRRFESLYDINHVTNTEIHGISVPLGVAAGRYPEDVYDGVGTSRGNPWSLVTSALAEYHYRLALAYAQTEHVAVSPELTALLEWTAPYLQSGGEFNATLLYSRDGYQGLLSYLLKAGDLYMARVAKHTDRDHTMYEQWNRYTGYGQGAKHLTWSYAAHMSAARARSELISTIN